MMIKKLSMKELMVFEEKHNLWEHKLFDYPLWIHCREPLWSKGMMVERKVYIPKIMDMTRSLFETVKFLFQQKNYEKVYFLMERTELLEIYTQDTCKNKTLFLNPEQEKVYEGEDYISSDFFNLLRFFSRKIAYIFFNKRYKKMINHLSGIGEYNELGVYIKNALGDALFLKFLSVILSKKNKKYYSGSVIPMGEKFINMLNSHEVQHGVIYPDHIGYIGIPEVKNTLILYSKHYEKVMRNNGYTGKLVVQNYKKSFFERETKRNLSIVLYTQPTEIMQKEVSSFFKKYKPKNFFIQKHPKDYFDYEIDEHFFVNSTTPNEVEYPIMYTTTVIENFILYEKKCYIYDLKFDNINIKESLSKFTDDLESCVVILDSLEKIYQEILKEIGSKEINI